MLGIGSGAGRSGKVRKIVKNGLQAWYKCDTTQAPLGEEEVANGDFSLGAEVVINGDFNVSEAVTTSSDSLGWKQVGSEGGGVSITNGELVLIGSDGTGVEGDGSNYSRVYITNGISSTHVMTDAKTYKLTYTVSSVSGSTDLEYHNGSGYSDATETIGTHIVYFTQDTGLYFILRNNGANGSIVKLSNVSIQQTNPNDSWVPEDTSWAVKDGSAEYTDGSGTKYIRTADTVATIGKKYKLTYTVSGNTGRLGIFDDGAAHALLDYVDHTVGNHELEFVSQKTGRIRFYGTNDSAGDFSISNISLKEITNSVRDYSSNHNNAVLYSGKALDFDDSGDWVDLGSQAQLSDNWTIVFWAYPDDNGNNDGVLNWGKTKINFSDATSLEVDSDLDGTVIDHTIPSATAVWKRYVVTQEGTSSKVYINGEFNSVLTGPTTNHTAATSYIGKNDANTFDGKIADVQIYDKAWTPQDVEYDWNNPDKDVFDGGSRTEVLGTTDIMTSLSVWETSGAGGDWVLRDGEFDVNTSSSTYVHDNISARSTTTNYKLSFEVSNYTSGTVRAYFGSQEMMIIAGGEGTYSTIGFLSTATSSQTIYIQAVDDFVGTVKNVKLEEVVTQESSISPTDCKALYRLNEGAGDRVYNAAPVLGAELVTNGDFSTDSDWTKGVGWTISGGNASCDGTQSTTSGLIQNSVFTSGKIYKLSFNITSNGDDFKFWVNGTQNIFSTPLVDGLIEYTFTASATGSAYFEATSTFIGSIDNISVKEISLSNSYAYAGNPTWATAQPYIPQYAMSSYSKKMVFDGSDDYVELATEKTIAAADPFSFSFWYYNIDESADQPILGRDGSTDDYLVLDGGHEGLIYKVDGTSRYLTFNSDLTTGKLNHVVLTSTGGEISGGLKCYVNGYLQTDTEPSLSSDFHYRDIMQSQGTFGEGFIDELAHFSTELSANEVSELFNAGMALDARDHSEASNLEGYWRNNGTDQWDDLSTNDNHGAVNGSPVTIQLQEVPYFGKDSLGLPMNHPREGGLNFDGTGYVEIADDNSLDFGTNDFSVEAWVKPGYIDANSSYNTIYAHGGDGVSDTDTFSLTILGSNNKIRFFVNGEDCESGALTDDKWYHVVGTREGEDAKLYVTAHDAATPIAAVSAFAINHSAVNDSVTNAHPKKIGRDSATSRGWTNNIDSVRLYDEKALSLPEVIKNWKKGRATHKSTVTWSDDL